MSQLMKVVYGGKEYPVNYDQTACWSHTTMKKKGLVYHVTTSNSYEGTLSWFNNPAAGASAMFVIGQHPGQITQMHVKEQMGWHAGRVYEPNARFEKIAIKGNMNGSGYVNPNLYLDGIEFSGGVDKDKSGKVERDEVYLTEWQYTCAEQIAQWHANTCGYELTEDTQIIHQDIASYKPDLSDVLDEIKFRLFKKKGTDKLVEEKLQEETLEELEKKISMLQQIVQLLMRLKLMKK